MFKLILILFLPFISSLLLDGRYISSDTWYVLTRFCYSSNDNRYSGFEYLNIIN